MAAHAETIYLKCWARGLTGDQRNSVYINGEQVTVNLDDGTMHSWTFGSNLAVRARDTHLFFETALTLGNIWQNLFDANSVWQGFINRADGTLKAHKRDGTDISGALPGAAEAALLMEIRMTPEHALLQWVGAHS